jgi:anti-sigma B factor antagonist
VLFDVQRRETEGWTVLAVIGELDLSAVPRVRQVAHQALLGDGGTVPRVIVDLSSVDFLDSAGLGVVLGLVRRVRQAGGQVAVVFEPESSAGRLFAVLALDRVVPVAARLTDVIGGTTLAPPDAGTPVLAGEGGGHDG